MLRTPGFATYEFFATPGAMCAKDKARYCSAMTAADLSPDGIRTGQQMPQYFEAMQACGLARPAVMAKGCNIAQTRRDLGFIADFCPAQLATSCQAADPAKDAQFMVEKLPRTGQGRGRPALRRAGLHRHERLTLRQLLQPICRRPTQAAQCRRSQRRRAGRRA